MTDAERIIAAYLSSPLAQCFTHIDADTGENTTYNVTGILRELITSYARVGTFDLEPDHRSWLEEYRCLEPHRLTALRGNSNFLAFPMLFAEQDDGTHVLIDGAHRYHVLLSIGQKKGYAWIAKPELWRNYLIQTAPLTEEELFATDTRTHIVIPGLGHIGPGTNPWRKS